MTTTTTPEALSHDQACAVRLLDCVEADDVAGADAALRSMSPEGFRIFAAWYRELVGEEIR